MRRMASRMNSRSRCSPISARPADHRGDHRRRLLASDLVSLVQAQRVSMICLADLPPSPPSKTRYLVKRLRAALPDVRILVGRWAPPALRGEHQGLRDAGATLVASTLTEIRTYVGGLAEIPRVPLPEARGVHAA